MRLQGQSPLHHRHIHRGRGREELDEPGFDLALLCLGGDGEDPSHPCRCDILWGFDAECIEDHGAYASIAQRMAIMSQGSLPLTDIQDYVDIQEGRAWLKFTCAGQSYKIDCQVDDDWVDSSLFSKFVALLAKHDPTKIFFQYDLGGQTCILGCATHEMFRKLKKLVPAVEPL